MRVLAGRCDITIRRTRVLEDIYGAVVARIGEDLKRRLVVSFDVEDGLDYSGVSRCVLFAILHYTRTNCGFTENRIQPVLRPFRTPNVRYLHSPDKASI